MKTIFTTIAGLILLSTTVALGQEGGLDTSFGGDGKITTLVTFISGINAEALQSDGRIVTAGYGYNGTVYEFAMARYNRDGSVDTTFGLDGIDTTRLRSGNSIANAIAIEPNGKIILAGKSSNANLANSSDTTIQFALARYTSRGVLDSTFGTDGIDTFYIGSSDDEGNGIALQPDGKILVAGFSNFAKKNGTTADVALIRVDTNGLLDTTFNKTGKVLTAIGPNNDRGYAVAVQADGKIFVAGGTNNGTTRVFALVRYDSTGIVDSSFGKKGVATINFWNNSDVVNSIAFQPNGKIILGGITIGANTSFALARIDTNGTVDAGFGVNGLDTTQFYGVDDEIRSIATDSIGRIIAAGFTSNTISGLNNFALARYDTSGIIDTTFVTKTGKVSLDIGTTIDVANAMVIQHDDKILLAGYARNLAKEQFALARYDIRNDIVSGVAEIATNNTNSLFLYPNPVTDEALLKYTLTTDEKVTINIYDVMGRLVEPVIINENITAGSYEEPLNLSDLPAGFYILNLSNTNSQGLSIKLVKE